MGSVKNIQLLLRKVLLHSTSDTRIIIDFYNPLWNPIIRLGEKIGLKIKSDVVLPPEISRGITQATIGKQYEETLGVKAETLKYVKEKLPIDINEIILNNYMETLTELVERILKKKKKKS